ncbi:MAG TPA: aminotransferase class I/II-fold pyridoxal phosphate-dependent enzyme, partial [Longimicrobiales bacterium]|nr:aminotransferase class I/II-fold pyridoxal phosphate-dependent enzyme [Longimicrobiales bacterium]
FASGQGATSTTLTTLLSAGDHVVAQRNHYMGTTKMLTQVLARYGVEATFVDQRSVQAFEGALTPKTRMIVLETPVNPLMHVTDLRAVCDLARSRGILTFCDNTFATPINQQPMRYGVDLVMHSTTKYIGGHHDHLGGCVCASEELCARIWDTSMTLGAIPAPISSWLGLRGVRTLGLRVERQNRNAQALAEMLDAHPAVREVFYPGLESHPQHELAASQMRGFGGLLTWDMEGGYDAAAAFIDALGLGHNAPSLGGVQSVAVQPAVMFGGRLDPAVVQEQGILPGMIRFACGIENTRDLVEDVERALEGRRA